MGMVAASQTFPYWSLLGVSSTFGRMVWMTLLLMISPVDPRWSFRPRVASPPGLFSYEQFHLLHPRGSNSFSTHSHWTWRTRLWWSWWETQTQWTFEILRTFFHLNSSWAHSFSPSMNASRASSSLGWEFGAWVTWTPSHTPGPSPVAQGNRASYKPLVEQTQGRSNLEIPQWNHPTCWRLA